MYLTTFPLTAYAVVRKSHLPCDSEDSQDWIASRIYRLISGTDTDFKSAISVIQYEVIPNGYVNEIKSLTANYEWACVAIDVDVSVVSASEDGCYDICATGDIPLPDLQPCTPCLTEVAVDGVTITGNGTEADPLVAIGGGGGTPLRTQDEGVNVSTNTTTLNFTGNGVTASLTSPGVVEVNIPSGGGGGGVTSVSGTAPIASSGGSTPAISIAKSTAAVDGYLAASDFTTFNGKQNAITLTTTGTSGAATLVGATLNVPQYVGSVSVFKNTTDGASSTSTTNTFSQSILIPANSVALGKVLEFKLRGRKTGAANTFTIRLYVNTTNNLSGSPLLLATFLGTATQALSQQIVRTGAVKNVTTNTELLAPTTANAATDFQNTTFSAVAVDWTTQLYLIGATQCTAGTDTALISLISMTII